METKDNDLIQNEQEKVLSMEMEQPQNVEQEIKRYKRVDIVNGELTNPDVIGAYKISQTYDVAFNSMLGDYDENGDYVISEEILNSLVKLNKRVVRAFGDTLYLESTSEFPDKGRIQFILSFIRVGATKQKAVLKITEPVSKINGYVINTHTFVVATYTDENTDNYINKINKVFHISDSDEDEVGKEDPQVVATILKRLKMLQLFREEILVGLKEREEKYFLDRLEVLKDPKFEKILNEFDKLKRQTKLFLSPDDPLYFLYLNTMLDMAVESMLYVNEYKLYQEAIKEMTEAMREYTKTTEMTFNKARQIVAEKMEDKGAEKIGATNKKGKFPEYEAPQFKYKKGKDYYGDHKGKGYTEQGKNNGSGTGGQETSNNLKNKQTQEKGFGLGRGMLDE